MPDKAPHSCAYPRCPNLTYVRYCDVHAPMANRAYNQHHRRPDSNKVYGRRWRTIRNLYVAKHPLCEHCLAHGRHVPAEEVHHIKPITAGGTHDESNLQALCKSCHSKITMSATNSKA